MSTGHRAQVTGHRAQGTLVHRSDSTGGERRAQLLTLCPEL
jgi:hypothetical protein